MGSRKPLRALALLWLAAILGAVVVPYAAMAAPIVQVDEQGPNDEPGQKDLTLHSVDNDGLPSSIEVSWNWDATGWSGKNTGDACALFDTDNDGLANYSLCVTVEKTPATQQTGSPRLWLCNDTRADRCAGPTPQPVTSTCTVAITATQPFAQGESTPNDTTATCTVNLSDMGGANAKLLNTCSYPSKEPNSDPSDCVLQPRDAFIRITKVATPNDGTPFPFTVDGNAAATINGSGTSDPIPVTSDADHVIAENVPQGWTLTDITCDGGTPTRSGSSVTVHDLAALSTVTCTFSDRKDNPSLTIDKVFLGSTDNDNNGVISVGDRLNYEITAMNNGNVTLTNVNVTDPNVTSLTCTPPVPVASLAPGGSVVCTGSHVVTQADIDAGTFGNTSTATSNETPPTTDTETVPIDQTPRIAVLKTGTIDAGGDNALNAGDIINYTIKVTNTGNVTLDPVTVSDPGVTDLECPATSLAPQAFMTCTASHTITQDDIDAGRYDNIATATGKPPTGPDVTGSDDETVTLDANASITLVKSGVLALGDDGATPGDIITYTMTVTNTGNVTLDPVTVSDPKITIVSCDDSSLAPQASTECDGTYAITQEDIDAGQVDNTATATGTPPSGPDVTGSGSTTVPIPRSGDFTVGKSSNVEVVAAEGDNVVYTITVTNTGNVTLTNVVVTDPVPNQTTYVSCTPSCTTSGNPVNQVSWTIASIPPGQSASVTMTVTVTSSETCLICNIASATSNQTTGAHSSPELCINVAPGAHPELANANGSALGAKVVVGLLNIDQTIAPTSSTQSGVGSDAHGAQVLSLAVPPPGGAIAKLGLINTASSSTVNPGTGGSTAISTAETLGVNLLNGAITADVVRAVAHASASGAGSTFSTLGSTIVNLKVSNIAINDVAPNTTIKLPAALFGSGSYVKLYERTGSKVRPAPGVTTGGTYAADVAVNMIHVFVKDSLPLVPGNQVAEIIVSGAAAHADFPQITLCQAIPDRAVSGHAFIADLQVGQDLLGVTVGAVSIPPEGGSAQQSYESLIIPDSGTGVTAHAVESRSEGFPTATQSGSTSHAQAENLCVLRMNPASCVIAATLVRSQANSLADSTGAVSNSFGTQLVGLMINGTPINVTPAPNTVIELPGIGFVILNEQFCDGTATLPSCAGPVASGITIRAIRVVITNSLLVDAGLGTQIIVAQAHADAVWR